MFFASNKNDRNNTRFNRYFNWKRHINDINWFPLDLVGLTLLIYKFIYYTNEK